MVPCAARPRTSGGVPGFYEFLDAISYPAHPDHDDRIEWYDGRFDSEEFDVERTRPEASPSKRLPCSA
jgi:pRiA4b ORF-3-like protein